MVDNGAITQNEASRARQERVLLNDGLARDDPRGAWFKEFICRSTIWALKMERLGISGIQWVKGRTEGESPAYSSS